MICTRCGSDKVNIQIIQVGAKSSTKGKGCLFSIVRWMLILCTLGLWLLFGKKKSKTTTRFIHQKVAVCQNCGNQWNVY